MEGALVKECYRMDSAVVVDSIASAVKAVLACSTVFKFENF
jgi:hypothetical protein